MARPSAATKIIGFHPIKLLKEEKRAVRLRRTGVYRIAATGIIIVVDGLYQQHAGGHKALNSKVL